MAEEEEPTQFDQSQRLPGAPTPISSLEVSNMVAMSVYVNTDSYIVYREMVLVPEISRW